MPESWLLVAVSVMGEMNIYTVAAVSYDPGFSDPFIYNLSGLLTIPVRFLTLPPCCLFLRARLIPVLVLPSLGFLAWNSSIK